VTSCAEPRQAGGTRSGLDDRRTVWHRIREIVAIIVDAITDFGIAVGHTQVSITGIANAVSIGVVLAPIDHLGTVVTGITDAVFVFVGLVGIRYVGTIVIDPAETIVVGIEADTTE
jgi:hypothetical protein